MPKANGAKATPVTAGRRWNPSGADFARRQPRPQDESDDGAGSEGELHEAASDLIKVEHLLEVQRDQVAQLQRPGTEEEGRQPQPAQGTDGEQLASGLAPTDRGVIGGGRRRDRVDGCAPVRFVQSPGGQEGNAGGYGEGEERHLPRPRRRDQTGDGAGHGRGGIGQAVDAIDLGVGSAGVAVRQQRRMYDLVGDSTDTRQEPDEVQQGHGPDESGGDRGATPQQSGGDGQVHPTDAVGQDAQRERGEQREDSGDGAEGLDAVVAQPERVADLGEQGGEGDAVELVDKVQREQHAERGEGIAHRGGL